MPTRKRPRYSPEIEKVYQLVHADKYAEAESSISRLRKSGFDAPELIFYSAMCAYEKKDDLGCLKLLNEFLEAAPAHKDSQYALFTAAICLVNVGLPYRAHQLLARIPSDYPDRDKEFQILNSTIETIERANLIADSLDKTKIRA